LFPTSQIRFGDPSGLFVDDDAVNALIHGRQREAWADRALVAKAKLAQPRWVSRPLSGFPKLSCSQFGSPTMNLLAPAFYACPALDLSDP
jgi:hypothetical protein